MAIATIRHPARTYSGRFPIYLTVYWEAVQFCHLTRIAQLIIWTPALPYHRQVIFFKSEKKTGKLKLTAVRISVALSLMR